MMRNGRLKLQKIFAVFLSIILSMSSVPMTAFAASGQEETAECSHVHDEECGYYELGGVCNHVHDETCGGLAEDDAGNTGDISKGTEDENNAGSADEAGENNETDTPDDAEETDKDKIEEIDNTGTENTEAEDIGTDATEEPEAISYAAEIEAVPAAQSDEEENARYSLDGGATWTNCNWANIFWKVIDDSYDTLEIELLEDVEVGEDAAGTNIGYTNQNWVIDGKGHSIRRKSGYGGFLLNLANGSIDNARVTLKDITIDGGAQEGLTAAGTGNLVRVTGNSTLILGEGAILQNNYLKGASGAGVWLGDGSSPGNLIMEAGSKIKDNKADDNSAGGGAIVIESGTFEMKGGEIVGNYAGNHGGGISNQGGSIVMSGGKIWKNSARLGGGALALMGSNASFTMRGGEITQNTIDGKMGGGALFHIGSSFQVSGSSNISGNTGEDGSNNVYLQAGKTMEVTGALSDGARIGVSAASTPFSDNPVKIGTGGYAKDEWEHFRADNQSYFIDYLTTSGAPGEGIYLTTEDPYGNVTTQVEQDKAGTSVAADESSMKNAVITQEEKEGDKDITVKLVVVNKTQEKPDEEKAEEALAQIPAEKLGAYFDILLEKIITEDDGGSTTEIISDTAGKMIQITIEIPVDMRGGSNYQIIRIHDNMAEALDTTQSGNKLTFETSKFSTYVIAYSPGGSGGEDSGSGENSGSSSGSHNKVDKGQSGDSENNIALADANSEETAVQEEIQNVNAKEPGTGQDKEPKTGDASLPWATVGMVAGAAYLLDLFRDKKGIRLGITEEQKNELVARLIRWGKGKNKFLRWGTLAVIFMLLVFYHSIGKTVQLEEGMLAEV